MTRPYKLLELTIIISMLTSLFVGNVISAEDPTENIVSTRLDIEFASASDLKVSVTMDVNQITVFDNAYTSGEIQSLNDSEIIGAIKLTLRNSLKEQLKNSFEHANVAALNEKPTREGAIFYDDFSVNLTSLFFGMDENINTYNFTNGVLYMGAIANYTFTLHANSGWVNTYAFSLNTPMIRHYTNGEETANVIQWQVDNSNGMHPTALAELQMKLDNYNQLRLKSEDIQLEFELDTRTMDQTSLITNIIARNIDIREYDILPSFVNKLDFVPSDGIRLFIDNGLITWDDFYSKTIEKVEDKIIPMVENTPSFNQTLDMVFSWDPETTTEISIPYVITNMANSTPVKAMLTDNDISFEICGISSRALFGLINTGAQVNITSEDVNFGEGLDEISNGYGYKYSSSLYLPENFYLDGNNTYIWGQSKPIIGIFESDIAENYTEDKIDTVVEIEISSTDLNLLSFFTGKTELNFGLSLQENKNYSVTTIPDGLNLPDKVILEFLNADGLRLCIEEKVFSENDVDLFLNDKKNLFETRLKNIFGDLEVDGLIDRDLFDISITNWDGDIMDMDDESPVNVKSYAHSSYTIPFDLSVIPPSFKIGEKTYNFGGLQKQSVTYRMIFPHGTTVEVSDTLNRVDVKEMGDGRQYIEITFNADEHSLTDEVTCKIIPSPLFIVSIFMPCILSLIITIILVIVIYIIRKKRKGGKTIKPSVEEDVTGYEDQDYYIPPPPSNR